jgi:hypothetical protein
LTVEAVAVAFSMAWLAAQVEGKTGDERPRGLLAAFRAQLYWCLGRRHDCLFELAGAVLCRQARVHMPAELSLEPECQCGHGVVYDGGQLRPGRYRPAVLVTGVPAVADLGGRADPAERRCL